MAKEGLESYGLMNGNGGLLAIETFHTGRTDDGARTVHAQVVAEDSITGRLLVDFVQIKHGGVMAIHPEPFVIGEPSQRGRNRASTSLVGAFDGNDRNVATWQPTGPTPPGKPRLD